MNELFLKLSDISKTFYENFQGLKAFTVSQKLWFMFSKTIFLKSFIRKRFDSLHTQKSLSLKAVFMKSLNWKKSFEFRIIQDFFWIQLSKSSLKLFLDLEAFRFKSFTFFVVFLKMSNRFYMTDISPTFSYD